VRLKLLHTSDCHLGHPFRSFRDDTALTLTRQRRSTVEHVLRVAASHSVDAVLCAGDLFDCPSPGEDCWRSLVGLFQAMTHRCPVFLLPGGHDPLSPKSVYDSGHPFRADLPDWVHVVDTLGFEAPLGDGAVLVAHPTLADAGGDDPALALPNREPGDDRVRVGMAYGTVMSAGGKPAFPIAPDAAVQRGLNYLALGDVHDFTEVHAATAAGVGLTVYAGAPEAMRFGEGAGSAVLAQLRPHGQPPRYRRERVGHFSWEEVRCAELSELRTLAGRTNLQRTVLRLALELAVTLDEKEELARLLSELSGTEIESGRVGVIERIDRRDERLAPGAFATELPDHLPQVMHEVHARLRARLADPEQRAATETALIHLHRLIAEAAP
jgi:DNA repair exonuclease SbcCD nuclease subunit